MTTHDQRAATAPTQTAEPEFSSTGTEAPRVPDDRPADSDPIVDDASSPHVPNSRKLGRCRREPSPRAREAPRAEPAHARDASPPSARRPVARDDVQPSRAPTSSRPGHDAQPSGDELLFATDTSGLRSRWDDIQAAFVDDPTDCVQKADALVEEVVEQLTAGFSEARSRLEAQWARGEHASTEDLRVALQRYREFFQRLLAV